MKKIYLEPTVSEIKLPKDDIMNLSAILGDIIPDGHISWNYDENMEG